MKIISKGKRELKRISPHRKKTFREEVMVNRSTYKVFKLTQFLPPLSVWLGRWRPTLGFDDILLNPNSDSKHVTESQVFQTPYLILIRPTFQVTKDLHN